MCFLNLDVGANPNQTDRLGDTPLHKAAQEGYTDVARILIDKHRFIRRLILTLTN